MLENILAAAVCGVLVFGGYFGCLFRYLLSEKEKKKEENTEENEDKEAKEMKGRKRGIGNGNIQIFAGSRAYFTEHKIIRTHNS